MYIAQFKLLDDEGNYQRRFNFVGIYSGRQRRPIRTRTYQATVTADHVYDTPVNPGNLASPWKCMRWRRQDDPDNPVIATLTEIWEMPTGNWEDDT
jgi:hypothetical protein